MIFFVILNLLWVSSYCLLIFSDSVYMDVCCADFQVIYALVEELFVK